MIHKIAPPILFLLLVGVLIGAVLPARALPERKIITLELKKTSGYSRTGFGQAYTLVWSGDVTLKSKKVGEFTATLTRTSKTKSNQAVQQYDVVIPSEGPLGDFFSIRTNHLVSGAGADHGVVFAASPDYKFLIGATVVMKGNTTQITWESGRFPAGSPLAQ